MADSKYVDFTSPEFQGYMKEYQDEDKYNASQTDGDNAPFLGLDKRAKWLSHEMGMLGHLVVARPDPLAIFTPLDYELVYVYSDGGPGAPAYFKKIKDIVNGSPTNYEVPATAVIGMIFPVDTSRIASSQVYTITDESPATNGTYYYILIGSSTVAIPTATVADVSALGGRSSTGVVVGDYLFGYVPNDPTTMTYPTGQFGAFPEVSNFGRTNNWLRFKMFGNGFDSVWKYKAAGTVWTDLTDNARFPYDPVQLPYKIVESASDYFYFGSSAPFADVYFDIETVGTDIGSLTLQISSGVDASGTVNAWSPVTINNDGTALLTRSGTITCAMPGGWVTGSLAAQTGGTHPYYWMRLSVNAVTISPKAYTTTFPRLSRIGKVLSVTDTAYVITFGYNDQFGTGVVQEQTHENLVDVEAENMNSHGGGTTYNTPQPFGTVHPTAWSGSDHYGYVNRVIDIPYSLFDSSKVPVVGELVECAAKSDMDTTRVFRRSENAPDGVLYGICAYVNGTASVSVIMRGPWYPTDEASAARATLFGDISGLAGFEAVDLHPGEAFTLELWDNGHVLNKSGSVTDVTPLYKKVGDPNRVNIRRVGYIYRVEDKVTGAPDTYPLRVYVDVQNGINDALDLSYNYFTSPPTRSDIPSYPQYYETWGTAPSYSASSTASPDVNESRYYGIINPDLGAHISKLRSVKSNVGAGVLDQFILSEGSFSNDSLINVNSNTGYNAFVTQYDPRVMCDTAIDAVPGSGAVQKPALTGVYKADLTAQFVDLIPSYYGSYRMPDREWAQCQDQILLPGATYPGGLLIDFIEYDANDHRLTVSTEGNQIWLWDDVKSDFYAGTDASLPNPETCNPMVPTAGMLVLAHDHDANTNFLAMWNRTSAGLWSSATNPATIWATPLIGDMLYIGHDTKFDKVYFYFSAAGAATYTVEYWDGASWLSVPSLVDTTTGMTVNGSIAFAIPSGWAAYDLENDGGTTPPHTGQRYWIRLNSSGGSTSGATAYIRPLASAGAIPTAIPKAALVSYEGFRGIGTSRLTFYNVKMYQGENWITDPNISKYGWRDTFTRVIYDDGYGNLTDYTDEAKTQTGTPFILPHVRSAGVNNDALLIGIDGNRFYQAFLLLSQAANAATGTLSVQYWAGSWTDVDTPTDGTAVLSNTLQQSGAISWTITVPANWVTTKIDGSTLYWIKIQLSAGTDLAVVPYAYMAVNDTQSSTGQWFSSITGQPNAWEKWYIKPMLTGGMKLNLTGKATFNSFGVVPLTNESWSATSNLSTPRVDTGASLLSNGKILVAGGSTDASVPSTTATKYVEVYNPLTGFWSYTSDMFTARHNHQMVELGNGKAMVIGGNDGTDSLAFAEIYDPTTQMWNDLRCVYFDGAIYHDDSVESRTPSTPPVPFTVIAANSDFFYVGSTERFNNIHYVKDVAGAGTGTLTAEYWNGTAWTAQIVTDGTANAGDAFAQDGDISFTPNADWTSNNTPPVLHAFGSIFWLQLSCAGYAPGTAPTAQRVLPQIVMGSAREQFSATVLLDGRVLVAGGYSTGAVDWLDSVEVYDPAIGSWTAVTGTLATKKGRHEAVLWPGNGNVFLIGGCTTGGSAVDTVDQYSYAPGGLGSVGAAASNMATKRQYHGASLFYHPATPNVPRILVTGGIDDAAVYLNTTEIFDGTNWTAGPAMNTTRSYHEQVTTVSGNQVLVAGGESSASGFTVATSEVFTDDGAAAPSFSFGSGEQINARERAALVHVSDTQTMFVGGANASGVLNSAEVLDTSVSVNTSVWNDFKKSGLNVLGSNADDPVLRGTVYSAPSVYGWDEVDDSTATTYWNGLSLQTEFATAYPFDYVPTDRLGTLYIDNIISNKKLGPVSKQYPLPVHALTDAICSDGGAGNGKAFKTGIIDANTNTLTRINNTREFWKLTGICNSTASGSLSQIVDAFFSTIPVVDFNLSVVAGTLSFAKSRTLQIGQTITVFEGNTDVVRGTFTVTAGGTGTSFAVTTITGSNAFASGDKVYFTGLPVALDAVKFLPGLRLNLLGFNLGGNDINLFGLIPYRVERSYNATFTIYFRYPANQEAWTDATGGILTPPSETSSWTSVTSVDWEWYHTDALSAAPSLAVFDEHEVWVDVSKKCSDRAYGLFFSVKDATSVDALDVSLAQSQFYDGARVLTTFGIGTEIYRYMSEGDALRFFVKPRASSPTNIER